jgi:hypothetical protein
MFAQSIDFDQAQRLEQDEAIEAVYLEGISDAASGRLPVMTEIIYLQGFCEGMKQRYQTIDSLPQEEQTELPLVCGQCAYLNNGKCAIKGVTKTSNSSACDRIKIDYPF